MRRWTTSQGSTQHSNYLTAPSVWRRNHAQHIPSPPIANLGPKKGEKKKVGESDIFSSYFQRWRLDYEKVSEGWLGTHSRSNLAVRQSSGNLVASDLVDSSDTFSFAIVSCRNVSHSEAQLDVTESGRQRKRIDGTRPFYRSRAWRHHAQFYVTLTIRQVYLIHPSPLLLLLIWRVDSNIFCVCVCLLSFYSSPSTTSKNIQQRQLEAESRKKYKRKETVHVRHLSCSEVHRTLPLRSTWLLKDHTQSDTT